MSCFHPYWTIKKGFQYNKAEAELPLLLLLVRLVTQIIQFAE